jgi:DNA (cytosine-5)-methyltransferase 1
VNELVLFSWHLFAGAGGGILADHLLGSITLGGVEIEKYPRESLFARQADGILPGFPVWDDVETFRADNPECAKEIDILRRIRKQLVICGGFPCTDISIAGKGAGIDGPKSRLWKEQIRIIGEIRPKYAFVENAPRLVRKGLARVLGDFTELGYVCGWCRLGASDVGANHYRKRAWLLAESEL